MFFLIVFKALLIKKSQAFFCFLLRNCLDALFVLILQIQI